MNIFTKFRNRFYNIENKGFVNETINQDIFSLTILSPLITNKPYLPINGGALRPFAIAFILNEILINKRKKIIEFGSGISTILIARLLKHHNLKCKVISIEHNKEWINTLNHLLNEEKINEYVQIVYSPLKKIEHKLGATPWYDIPKDVISRNKFDLVIIDGPPAYEDKYRFSRYPAMETIIDSLCESCFILLDDANRYGEQKIIELWEKQYNLNFNLKLGGSFAVLQDEALFNAVPIKTNSFQY